MLILTVLEVKLSLGQIYGEIADKSTILSTPTFIEGLDPEAMFIATLNMFIKGRLQLHMLQDPLGMKRLLFLH